MKFAALSLGATIGLCLAVDAHAQTFSKTANPATGVPPLTVVYTYKLDNTQGTNPLSSVSISDDQCSPVTQTGGDANNNQALDIGETWTFTCTKVITSNTTNTAQVSGQYTTCSGSTCSVHFVDFLTATATVTLPALAVSIHGNTSACKNDVVTLTAVPAGGNPPYTFLWTSGATSQAITVNTSVAGTYNFGVTVKDGANHSVSATATVSVAEFCIARVDPTLKNSPDLPLLTTITWGCGWSFAGRCLSPTIVQICIGGQCFDNPANPLPGVCPRCDLAAGAGAGALVGFGAAALVLGTRRRRGPTAGSP